MSGKSQWHIRFVLLEPPVAGLSVTWQSPSMVLPSPLLEDDLAHEAVLEPGKVFTHTDAPRQAVICFFQKVIHQEGGQVHATLTSVYGGRPGHGRGLAARLADQPLRLGVVPRLARNEEPLEVRHWRILNVGRGEHAVDDQRLAAVSALSFAM